MHTSTTCLKQRAARTFAATLTCLAGLNSVVAEPPTYTSLKPDEFMKRWLVLKPIPVAEKKAEPTEAAQKKAFAEDWLTSAGGEAKVRPTRGMKQKIADKEL